LWSEDASPKGGNAVTKLSAVAKQIQSIRSYLQEEFEELIDLRDKVAEVERQFGQFTATEGFISSTLTNGRSGERAWQQRAGHRH
jgi:hypothetical protein